MDYTVQFKTADQGGWETLAKTANYEIAEVLVQAYLGKGIDRNRLRVFNDKTSNQVYF
jgi:hypothetical protein